MMIRYNFRPNLTDHTQVLILVKPFYNASDKDYNYALKKLVVFTHAKIEGSLNRKLLLNFTKGYTRETLEWGRLQLHRRPLGFIGVARLSNDPVQHKKDFEKIEHRFGNVISQYDNHIYDSRCIVVGPENPDITIPKKDFLYVPLTNKEERTQLAEFLNEFISSIFVILESKRVDKMGENIDKMILPTAPSEQEQTITESDTRFMKKKFIGRNKKVLGDLSLLAGLYEESVTHYLTAVEHGQSCNDYLWTGSALEGICAASNAISLGNDIIKQNSLSLVIAKSSVNVHTTSESDSEQGKQSGFVLTVDDMISKYSECLNYYRRSSTIAGPVVLEAHFKFIRVLLKLKKKIEVAQVVQSLLSLPITFNDTEQTEQSSMLASIHEQCEMHRKAAFYRRKAAMSYIKVADVDITQAMAWLKRATPAYKIYLDGNGKKSESSGAAGWPTVQLTVLLNMLEISRRLENRLECVRLLCYILEKFAENMNWVDHSELVELLEEYSDTASSSSASGENSVTSVSENSNVQLIRPIPIIRGFAPKKLAYHLQPLKTKKTESSGPFIFSSLSTKVKSKEESMYILFFYCLWYEALGIFI